jgi:hypothetical protein
MLLTRCVAIAVAICLAGHPAWGHNLPPVHTVVVQVEPCELAVMIGYRPASGVETDRLLARIASHPKSRMVAAAKSMLASQAMAPFAFSVGGTPLVPTNVRAKLGLDPGKSRPIVVVLATFAIPRGGGTLLVTTQEPRTTRISWTDRASRRVDLEHAPARSRWFAGVASLLLKLAESNGDSACATSPRSP